MTQLCSYEYHSDCISFIDNIGLGGFGGRTVTNGNENDPCVYCGKALSLTRHIDASTLHLQTCANCGWWALTKIAREVEANYVIQRYGVAKFFAIDDLNAPLDSLRQFLKDHPDHVAHVNPHRFELLMAECLKDYFGPCEVIHTGRSGDGGVDIKLVCTDGDTYLVQVKRRTHLDRPEGVRVIRELNGVLFREGQAKGMIITTAERFSAHADQETRIKTPLQGAYEMRLLVFDDIVSMLRLPRRSPYEPWKQHIHAMRSA